jgi:hypothetical protein
MASTAAAQQSGKASGPVEVALEDLRPGLLAVYRSLHDPDGTAAL